MPGNPEQTNFYFMDKDDNSGLDNELPPEEDDDRDEKVENREEGESETIIDQPEIKETGKYLPFDIVTDGLYECQRDFKIGAYEFEAGYKYELFSASLVTIDKKKCLRVQEIPSEIERSKRERFKKEQYNKRDWPSSLANISRVEFKKAFKLLNIEANRQQVAKVQARRQEIAGQKAAEAAGELRLEKRRQEELVRRRGRTELPKEPEPEEPWWNK